MSPTQGPLVPRVSASGAFTPRHQRRRFLLRHAHTTRSTATEWTGTVRPSHVHPTWTLGHRRPTRSDSDSGSDSESARGSVATSTHCHKVPGPSPQTIGCTRVRHPPLAKIHKVPGPSPQTIGCTRVRHPPLAKIHKVPRPSPQTKGCVNPSPLRVTTPGTCAKLAQHPCGCSVTCSPSQ